MTLLVTGGAGFIGSNFVRMALDRWPNERIVVLDALTYAGNLENLSDVLRSPRVSFVHGDICSPEAVHSVMDDCRRVVNFAAETHVDRSIVDSGAFIHTDVEGTRVLLDAVHQHGVERYLHVSTDEVYGHLEWPQRAREDAPVRPRNPYAASKAAGDLLVGAYRETYGLPTLITRGSNTYGPYQFPEKLIPLMITNALLRVPLPVYGDGLQARDWLHVEDHCRGIATVLDFGGLGEIYNLGTEEERPNLEVVELIVELVGAKESLVQHVADRLGHDRRYALDTSKARSLEWAPEQQFVDGLESTVRWYEQHEEWWQPLRAAVLRVTGTGYRQ